MDGNNATVGFISWVCWHWFSLSATIGFLFLCKPLTEEGTSGDLPSLCLSKASGWRCKGSGGHEARTTGSSEDYPLHRARQANTAPPLQGYLLRLLHVCLHFWPREPWALGSRHKLLVDMESKWGRRWHPKEDMLQKEGERERSTGVICSNDCSRDGNKQQLTS